MLTLIKTETRSNGWTRYFFKDNQNYEFFVQRPNEQRIRERVKNLSHPVGKAYQQGGLMWEADMREVIDSSPQQVAEKWYDNFYKKDGIPPRSDPAIERLQAEIVRLEKDRENNRAIMDALQEEIDRLKKDFSQEKVDHNQTKKNFQEQFYKNKYLIIILKSERIYVRYFIN